MKRALVVNTARMGDLIQSTPLMQGLAADGWEVTLLYSDAFGQIARMLKGPSRLIPMRFAAVTAPLVTPNGALSASYVELDELTSQLRALEFDLAVNITHTRYSAGLMKLTGAKETLGMTLDARGNRRVKGSWANYYFNSILNRGFNRFNLVDIHRLTARVAESYPVAITVPDQAKAEAENLLGVAKGVRFVGVVPGASTVEKRWPVESFASAIRIAQETAPFRPVILGAPNEKELALKLRQLVPDAIDLCGRTDIAGLAALIERVDLLISNDTGPIHIAAAVGTRVVDVTLGSAMAAESAPYGSGHYVVEPRIGCFSCLPKLRCSHHSCHQSIKPDLIAEIVSGLLNDGEWLPTSIPVSADVYRTGFDADGFFDLNRLNEKASSFNDLLNQIFRELWKNELAIVPVTSEAVSLKPVRLGLVDRTVAETLCREIRQLGWVAGIGEQAARRISVIGGDPSKTSEIVRLGEALRNTDEGVAKLAYARPEMMPLAAQFTYAKENLDAVDLAELAKGTADIYGALARWCEIVAVRVETALAEAIHAEGAVIDAA